MKPLNSFSYVPTKINDELPEGTYNFVVTDIFDNSEKQYVAIIADVLDGEYKDFFKNVYKDCDKFSKNLHNRAILSYKSKGGMEHVIERMKAITLSNSDFDAEECWNQACEHPELLKEFIGKIFRAEITRNTSFVNSFGLFEPVAIDNTSKAGD